jgi:hypothetical protein
VLDNATAPARPGELTGEQTAVAAFRTAQLDTTPRPRSRFAIKATLARLLTVKVAAAAATVALGGVAVAAATGHLPTQLGGPSGRPITSRVISTTTSVSRAGIATGAQSRQRGSGSRTPPSPSLAGLCHAYAAGAGDHAKVLANPAFTALLTAAGGQDDVPAYCAALLGRATASATPTSTRSNREHHPGPPSTHPTGPPTTHPHPHH